MDSKRVIIEDFLIECNYPSAKVFQLEESVLLSISDKVATKLYQLAAKKYEDIDFGGLENSKGNIDNWKEYETLKNTLDLLNTKANGSNKDINLAREALENVYIYRIPFEGAYKENIGSIKMIYTLMVRAIVEYSTYLVTSTMNIENGKLEYTPNKGRKNRYIESIETSIRRFNDMCKEGELDKMYSSLSKNKSNIIMATIGFVGVALAMVFIIRLLIAAFWSIRASISKFLEVQILLIEAHENEISGEDAEKIKAKQKAVKEKLQKLKNAIDGETNKVNPDDTINKENKETEKDTGESAPNF